MSNSKSPPLPLKITVQLSIENEGDYRALQSLLYEPHLGSVPMIEAHAVKTMLESMLRLEIARRARYESEKARRPHG